MLELWLLQLDWRRNRQARKSLGAVECQLRMRLTMVVVEIRVADLRDPIREPIDKSETKDFHELKSNWRIENPNRFSRANFHFFSRSSLPARQTFWASKLLLLRPSY